MKYWLLLMVLLLAAPPARSAAPNSLTVNQKGILVDLLRGDLETFLEGGDALFANDWSVHSTPWTTDRSLGIQYSRNAVAADATYANKFVFVRGVYLGSGNWIGSSYRIQMQLAAAIVKKEDSAFLALAQQGGPIAMACLMKGLEIDTVYLDACQAAKYTIDELASREATSLLSREDAQAKKAVILAKKIDSVIPQDDVCRATLGGCDSEIRKAVSRMEN